MIRLPRARSAILGVLVLAVSGIGIYFSMQRAGKDAQLPGSAFAFRVHEAAKPVPDLAFEDDRGGSRRLGDFRGKIVLLNVWATWCVPCREEMPALDRLQRELGGPGFEVVALSIDTGGVAVVKGFYEEIGIRSLPIYVDASMRATSALGTVGLPTTLLIDAEGREIGRHIGPAEWDSPEAVRLIAGYVK